MSRATTATAFHVGGRTVEIHRPDKVLFPDGGWTKADLARYYRRVARRMLPHLRDRPLMLERHPDGVAGPQFLQKEAPGHYPPWVRRVQVAKEGGTVTHVVCDDTATLLYLADQACVTLHRWLATASRPRCPDRLVFDLDPPGEDFEPVRRAARALHDLLDELRLPSAAMTTGSRGLHVLVPLDRTADVDEVREFARAVAEVLAARHPDELTTAARKEARGGRLYLDVQRNAYAQTAVAPYTVRALPDAPVAAPIGWEELDDPKLTARSWTIATMPERLDHDPWRELPRRGRSLGSAGRRLAQLK